MSAPCEAIWRDCFNEAVVRFGKPISGVVKSFGITFGEGGLRLYNNDGEVLLQLSLQAKTNEMSARYEMAHEAVHVLCGLPGMATGLEEGVAVVFAQDYVKSKTGADASANVANESKYGRARNLVRQLIRAGADIKVLRADTGGCLSGEKITEAVLKDRFHGLSDANAAFLATPVAQFRSTGA
jgi:hypothetical protein